MKVRVYQFHHQVVATTSTTSSTITTTTTTEITTGDANGTPLALNQLQPLTALNSSDFGPEFPNE